MSALTCFISFLFTFDWIVYIPAYLKPSQFSYDHLICSRAKVSTRYARSDHLSTSNGWETWVYWPFCFRPDDIGYVIFPPLLHFHLYSFICTTNIFSSRPCMSSHVLRDKPPGTQFRLQHFPNRLITYVKIHIDLVIDLQLVPVEGPRGVQFPWAVSCRSSLPIQIHELYN